MIACSTRPQSTLKYCFAVEHQSPAALSPSSHTSPTRSYQRWAGVQCCMSCHGQSKHAGVPHGEHEGSQDSALDAASPGCMNHAGSAPSLGSCDKACVLHAAAVQDAPPGTSAAAHTRLAQAAGSGAPSPAGRNCQYV